MLYNKSFFAFAISIFLFISLLSFLYAKTRKKPLKSFNFRKKGLISDNSVCYTVLDKEMSYIENIRQRNKGVKGMERFKGMSLSLNEDHSIITLRLYDKGPDEKGDPSSEPFNIINLHVDDFKEFLNILIRVTLEVQENTGIELAGFTLNEGGDTDE